MVKPTARHTDMPLGIVIRKAPGITRWAAWSWRAVAVLPGAGPSEWTELRRDGETVEYHAATVTLTLWAADAEAYLANLSDQVPSIYVVMREGLEAETPLEVVLATASPYEGQDYADSSEELVEKVAMTPGLIAWVRDYAMAHYEPETFIKRKRDRKRTDLAEDGIGDARIAQLSDVYRAPKRLVQ